MKNFAKKTAEAWMPEDIKLPFSLFQSIISLLDDFEIEDFDADTIQLYGYILFSLNKIYDEIKFKEAFTRFFYTENGYGHFKTHMDAELCPCEEDLPF